jgi:hypothetical protein
MARPAQLVYTGKLAHQDSTQQRVVIAHSDDGLPLGWVLLFGGRNYWEPGDHVDDRGGATGVRDSFETPLEVAEARLRQALDAVSDYEPMWVWFAGLEMLHRRLQARGPHGFLHVEAAWMISDPSFRRVAGQAIPYAENLVNLVSHNRGSEIVRALGPLEQVCPFVPHGRIEDRARFARMKKVTEKDPAVLAVTLMGGVPPGDPSRFERLVADQYGELFSHLETLRYPVFPESKLGISGSSTTIHKEVQSGLFGKLRGLFSR